MTRRHAPLTGLISDRTSGFSRPLPSMHWEDKSIQSLLGRDGGGVGRVPLGALGVCVAAVK